MKGNEARIVLFLHPVKEFKEGQVSKAKPTSMILGFRSILLILGTTFALGVLAYVLYSFTNNQFPNLEVTSTTASSYQTDTPALTTESEVQPTKPVVSTSTTDTTEEGTKATTSNTPTTAVTPTSGS